MKILVADNQALFRDGISLHLKEILPDAQIYQASNYMQLIKNLTEEKNFELLIFDVEMHDMQWQEAMEQIKQSAHNAKIAVISSSEDWRTIKHILSAGADGYISKRTDIKDFQNAVKVIIAGKTYIPENLTDITPINNLSGKSTGLKTLTNRQSQVLDLIAQGKSNKQIAFDMGVSESTVKLHINALLRSLHVSNRTQAVITAQKMGII